MTTLPEKGEEIFGYKVMDQTTVSMLGARITELSHACSGARVLYIENDDRELGFNLIYRTPQLDQSQPHFRASDAVLLLPLSQPGYFL
jgi:hypothetical protein